MSAACAISASGMSPASSASFAPRSVRKLRSPSGSMSAMSRPVSCSVSRGEPWGHADRLEPRRLTLNVGRAHPADEVDLDAEGGEPRRLIGRRAAGLKRDRRAPVRAPRERPLGPHDDIGHHVADDEDAGRGSHRGAVSANSRRRGGAAGAYSRPSKSFMKLRFRWKRSLRAAT